MKKPPNVIRLQISRRLGKENWNIEEFMDCINTEIIARENYEYLKKDPEPLNHGHRYFGSALNVSSKTRKCVFCDSDEHYSDRCNIVTDIEKRKELLKKKTVYVLIV